MLLILTACGSSSSNVCTAFFCPNFDKLPITIHYSTSEFVDEEISLSTELWEKAVNKTIFGIESVKEKADITIRLGDTSEGYELELEGIARMNKQTGQCEIIISKRGRYKEIISHEIGHCLGFQHDSNVDSIMWHRPFFSGKHVTDEMKNLLNQYLDEL